MNWVRRGGEVKTGREKRGIKEGTWEPRENHIAKMAELIGKRSRGKGSESSGIGKA